MQIPYILNKEFMDSVRYTEETVAGLSDFIICFWEMQPKNNDAKIVKNIIIADGCIDLVVDYDNRQIGFVGMSKTNFEFQLYTACRFYGARMKPGAFYAITEIPAVKAMNNFIPIDAYDVNFDTERFFALSFDDAKLAVKEYFCNRIIGKKADKLVTLFDELSSNVPTSVGRLYELLSYSPKQVQRLFMNHFGLTPQMVLCILRFQKCLEILTSEKAKPGDILNTVNYYDQAHFINDFKRNIGLTPFELMRKYR